MRSIARARRFLRDLVRRSDMERGMSEEVQFHLARRAEDLAARRGLAPEEALRIARLEFGSVERYKEEARHRLGLGFFDGLRSDLRDAWRSCRRNKAFTAAAIIIMALGIGANTAIFTLMDAVLMRSLPVERPDELVEVLGQLPGQEPSGGFTNAIWEAVRDGHEVFSGILATSATHRFELSRNGSSEHVDGVMVSGGYFRTLGVAAAAGRLFDDADDHRGCPPVAVLSHGFWRSHFGGTPLAGGSTLTLNRQPFQVVGVSAPGFYGIEVGRKFDVAIPICASALFDIRNVESRGRWWLNIVGRLDPGVPPARLQARLDRVKPAVDSVSGSRRIEQSRLVAASVATGRSALRRGFGDALKLLMAGVAIVLLIACANLAGLMLTRATARAPEMAIRTALGAARLRLLRQVLTESVVVAGLGAVVGLLFARWGALWLAQSLSTEGEPIFVDLSLDARILAFTAAVTVLTGLLVGVLPALRSTARPVFTAMKIRDRHWAAPPSRFRTGRWIVAGQVALSLVLLIGGGLLLRTFVTLLTLDAGFDRRNVLVVAARAPWFAADTIKVPPDQREVIYEDIVGRLRAIPGVVAVARGFTTPIGDDNWFTSVSTGPANDTRDEAATASLQGRSSASTAFFNFVTPGYFATLRIPVLAGRDIDARDTKQSAPVAVVNESFARKFLPGVAPLGRTFRRGSDPAPVEIVGVVKDSKYESLRDEPPPTVFLPAAQAPRGGEAEHFILRTSIPPSLVVPVVRRALADVNRDIPLALRTLDEQISDHLARERALATLAGFFGAVALLLAMIGLYGVLSYLVAHRQAEFGIRIALGAVPVSILRLVMKDVVFVLVAGLTVGLVVAMMTVNVLETTLFGLEPRDMLTTITSIALLSAMALMAGYVPARRATRVNPAVALRAE